jgi:hypothetical protein
VKPSRSNVRCCGPSVDPVGSPAHCKRSAITPPIIFYMGEIISQTVVIGGTQLQTAAFAL